MRLETNSLIPERFSTGIYVNLDPAAEEFEYEPDVDIKDLISLEDVMDEMGLGPNGGLMACFEYVPSQAFSLFYKRLL